MALSKTALGENLGVMMTPTSTQEHINRLIEFRQAVSHHGFEQRRDALFDTVDALLAGGTFASFAYLSQNERFQRKWPSLYAAVEDGQVNVQALRDLLVRQLPQKGICVFPLDSSSWPRPRSRVLKDLQYVYQASSDVDGGNITIGYPYSLLEWCAEAHTSWSLPLDVRRISSEQTAQDVGVAQIQALTEARADCSEALDIVPADGTYGNARFLSRVSGLRVGIVTRLRSDRVFYRPAKPRPGKRGRPSRYGERFVQRRTDLGRAGRSLGISRRTLWQGTPETLEWTMGQACSRSDLRPDPRRDTSGKGQTAGSRLVRLAAARASARRNRHHRSNHLDGLRPPLADGT